jgi:hypothetical protein
MTDDELKELLEASKPVPYMVIGGCVPESPVEKMMKVWQRIAQRVGCNVDSINDAGTGDMHDFIGTPI